MAGADRLAAREIGIDDPAEYFARERAANARGSAGLSIGPVISRP
jgi:hypothetical protein